MNERGNGLFRINSHSIDIQYATQLQLFFVPLHSEKS